VKVREPQLPGKSRETIIQDELAWHEHEAARRYWLDETLYDPQLFRPVIQSGLAFLDVKPGQLVLDMGSGEGKETALLAGRGAVVVSVDLSHVQLDRARKRVQELRPDGQVFFVQANAEQLPFATASFGKIYGKAIIHHLDIELSAREVYRLLRPGGRAVFAEPMAHHPIIWLGRRVTPHLRTHDEHPLFFSDLHRFASFFDKWQMEFYFLLTPLATLVQIVTGRERLYRQALRLAQRADNWLWHLAPALKKLAWYGVVKIER
jgi:SAM-dependent methyltransferase